ncbi:MAG: glycosyltransferase family 2 protein [Sandaracinaceae bacterium]|nr:glycosyltransferase family 2 protein [Sandaracinaceae bacterium]
MKLLAIVLNYRTPEMTLEAVKAAYRAMSGIDSAKIVVVDNDSQDGSPAILKRGLMEGGYDPERVELLLSPQNGGFGAGNNLAIRRALTSNDPPDFFYILNSDAFPAEDAVKILLDFLENHPEVGIAGSFIHGVDGAPHETAFRFPTIWSEIEGGLGLGIVSRLLQRWRVPITPIPSKSCQVDWLAGASMMIRRAVFEDVGLFDETFFLYFEETDFCRRALLAGWPTWYVVESRVEHVGSASTGMKTWKRIPPYWLDSRAHYFFKNHGPLYLLAADLAFTLTHATFRLRRRIQKKADPYPPGFYQDFLKHMGKRMLRTLIQGVASMEG